jgi:hypothetical protein
MGLHSWGSFKSELCVRIRRAARGFIASSCSWKDRECLSVLRENGSPSFGEVKLKGAMTAPS